MNRSDRILYLALPAGATLIALWASYAAAVDEGVVAGLASWAAFMIPIVWGAVGLAVYSDAAQAINNLPQVTWLLGLSVASAVLAWVAIAGSQDQALIMFVIGTVLGVFIFLQTPSQESALLKDVRGPSTPGVLVFYTGIVTGVGLLLVVH